MSPLFSSLGTSASGVSTMKTWIDAISDNVSNVNTVHRTSEQAFQSEYVFAQSVPGGSGIGGTGSGGIGSGVRVGSVQRSTGDGILAYDPDNPLADENGIVRRPNVDLAEQLTNLIIAQRAYSANVTVFERARDSYKQALEIGKG
jgi:flagellar basal-body rod protein FlgC